MLGALAAAAAMAEAPPSFFPAKGDNSRETGSNPVGWRRTDLTEG
jgi:hypothetical protein